VAGASKVRISRPVTPGPDSLDLSPTDAVPQPTFT
jgi:hypothetical protein